MKLLVAVLSVCVMHTLVAGKGKFKPETRQRLKELAGGQDELKKTVDMQEKLLKAQTVQIEDQKQELKALKAVVDGIKPTKPVAFMAQLSKSYKNPNKDTKVIFDSVVTNVGGAYNPSDGIFTAPATGLYNFNLVASSPSNPTEHMLHLLILKNNVAVGYVFLDFNKQYWLRRTTDVTISLVTGDQVRVGVSHGVGDRTLAGCCFHTHFSGFLINDN